MPAVVANPTQTSSRTRLVPQNHVVLLHDVSWEQYRQFRETGENDGVRMYYADGDLLLMTTGPLHERLSLLIYLVLLAWSEATGVPLMSFRHWTLKQDLKKKGLEADDCFYVSHLSDVRGKAQLDLAVDPPPDLAVEVDVTTHSQHKFAIYSALGIEEIWVWQADALIPYRLHDGSYEPVEDSFELPGFPFADVAELILEHAMDDDLAALQAFRKRFAVSRN